jgi:hypothetical protein
MLPVLMISLVGLVGAVFAPPGQDAARKPVVMLGVEVSNVRIATLGVPSGDRATIAPVNGPVFGLYATVVDERGVQLVIAELGTDPQTGAETTREMKRAVVALGASLSVDWDSKTLTVTWLELRTPSASIPDRGEPCTTCCVLCQDILVCGCNVSTPCGRCCCSEVCTCTIIGAPVPRTGLLPHGAQCSVPVMLK